MSGSDAAVQTIHQTLFKNVACSENNRKRAETKILTKLKGRKIIRRKQNFENLALMDCFYSCSEVCRGKLKKN